MSLLNTVFCMLSMIHPVKNLDFVILLFSMPFALAFAFLRRNRSIFFIRADQPVAYDALETQSYNHPLQNEFDTRASERRSSMLFPVSSGRVGKKHFFVNIEEGASDSDVQIDKTSQVSN